ncbi:MAG: DUF721 domain-containing protein [Paracoccaceae bacterium]
MRKPTGPRTGSRRGKGFQSASGASRGLVRTLASKKGFAEADVLLRWAEIVGEAHLGLCQPQTVRFSQDRSVGATLVVECTSAHAPEVEHLSPVLIDRVNQFYGYRAIGRIKVMQTAGLRGFAEAQMTFEGADAAPTSTHETRAADLAKDIQNPGLRAALARMGAHVLAQGRPSNTSD